MTGLLKVYVNAFVGLTAGFIIGKWFDSLETDRLTGYRDKSALFGRELKPGEPPSWP